MGFNQQNSQAILRKQLIYSDVISSEITIANANTTKEQVVHNIVFGKILKKYRLLKHPTKQPETNRNKLSKVQRKCISFSKKQLKGNGDSETCEEQNMSPEMTKKQLSYKFSAWVSSTPDFCVNMCKIEPYLLHAG